MKAILKKYARKLLPGQYGSREETYFIKSADLEKIFGGKVNTGSYGIFVELKQSRRKLKDVM